MKANWKKSGVFFLRFVAALFVMLLGESSGAFAQEKSGAKPQSPAIATKSAQPEPTPGAPSQKESRGEPHEGIKVHGHWTIVIKNPDGSVASRNEFENSLFQNGQVLLASVLSRNALIASWHVEVDSLGGVARPCNAGGTPGPCDISEPNAPGFGNVQTFPNLVLQVTGTNALTLTGSAKSSSGGNIQFVSTVVGSCSPTVPVSSCPSSASGIYGLPFTTHDLGTPITVQAGQTIDVTVTISFS